MRRCTRYAMPYAALWDVPRALHLFCRATFCGQRVGSVTASPFTVLFVGVAPATYSVYMQTYLRLTCWFSSRFLAVDTHYLYLSRMAGVVTWQALPSRQTPPSSFWLPAPFVPISPSPHLQPPPYHLPFHHTLCHASTMGTFSMNNLGILVWEKELLWDMGHLWFLASSMYSFVCVSRV